MRSSSERAGMAQLGGQRPQLCASAPRRERAVRDEHAHVGAGVARGDRLAVRPDAQHRVVRRVDRTR